MVYYSNQAKIDLSGILIGLMEWDKHPLEFKHALQYVDDIYAICVSLEKKVYHANTVYSTHKLYGSKVHAYKRNQQTTWYIIYDLDRHGNVYINKIISNYQTNT
jgi:hypothetical protein